MSKAQADPNCNKQVIITTEEYTTQQCPICDNIHHKIGGNEKINIIVAMAVSVVIDAVFDSFKC